MHSIWDYPEEGYTSSDDTTTDLAGFSVEALDGSIGKIDDATYETDASYVVVDTGPWIFGKKVLVPAGVIQRIDYQEETVYVSRTKDQIKDSPRFGDVDLHEAGYRDELGSYYATEMTDADMTHRMRPDS